MSERRPGEGGWAEWGGKGIRAIGFTVHGPTARLTGRESFLRHPIWLVDINHLRDDEGMLYEKGRLGRLAKYMSQIIEAATIHPGEGIPVDSALTCRRRPHHRTCSGHIRVSHTDLPPIVDWECTACADSGTISGWGGGPWDLRGHRDHRAASATQVTFVISAEEHRFLLACDSLDIDEPELASSATWRRSRIELRGSLVEYKSARETICEELDLMPRGRMRSVPRGLALRIQETLTTSPRA